MDKNPNYVVYVIRGGKKEDFFFNDFNDAVAKFKELDDKCLTVAMYNFV